MQSPLFRLVALITLSQMCLLYGGGLLLGNEEQFSTQKTSCARACCHLAKAGSPSAKSCCRLRCGEAPADPAPEPARGKLAVPLGLAAINVARPYRLVQAVRAGRLTDAEGPSKAPAQDLYLKHSILLV